MSTEARLTLLEVVFQAPTLVPRRPQAADPRIPLLRDEEDVPNLVLLRRARFYVDGQVIPVQPTVPGQYPRTTLNLLQASQAEIEDQDYASKMQLRSWRARLDPHPINDPSYPVANLTLLEVVFQAPTYYPNIRTLAHLLRGALQASLDEDDAFSQMQGLLAHRLRYQTQGGSPTPPAVSGRRYVWFIT